MFANRTTHSIVENKTKHLNIALICDSIDDITGGMFVSVNRFTTELKARGHNVVIITTKHKSEKETSNRFHDYTVYRFFSSFPIGPDKFRFILLKQSSLEEILIKHDIDVLYAIHPIYSGYIAIRAAKKLNLPVIMHMHVQPENVDLGGRLFSKTNKVLYKYFSLFYNRSDIVICPSEFAKGLLLEHKIKAPIEVISNGVNLNVFKKLPPSQIDYLYEKYQISRERFNLLVVSRLAPEKSVDTAIKAMPQIVAALPNAQMLIVSGGKFFKAFGKLIKKLHMQDHVKLLGRIPDADMVPIFNMGQLFVHPSLIELEGMVLLEAMACGLPLLVSDSKNSAAADLISANGATFIAKDREDLAEKTIALISNPARLAKMSATSLQNIKNYDINLSINRLEDVFNKAMTQKTSAPL